jgi:hypothetical protein
MPRRSLLVLALLSFGPLAFAVRADEFDRLDGPALAAIPEQGKVPPQERLSLAEIGQMPSVLRGTRSALIVVKTGQGNLARLLVSPALRKPVGGQGELIPVVVLDRFATFEAGKATTRLARGQDLILFDGFAVDLDIGQIVPEGQGGDLRFLAEGEGGPRLVTLGGAKLFAPSTSPLPPAENSAGPSPGRAVVPTDFNGKYRLFANGQWSGTLELKVGAKGVVSGQFRSDLNGTIYPVSGQVATDVPQRVRFTVKFPRTQQDFEGYLWTEGKGAMAGTLTMLGRPFGFFALREGGRFAPEGVDTGPLTSPSERPRQEGQP